MSRTYFNVMKKLDEVLNELDNVDVSRELSIVQINDINDYLFRLLPNAGKKIARKSIELSKRIKR